MVNRRMSIALAVVGAAMVVLPAVASAQSAHLNSPDEFSIAGGHSMLTRKDASTVTCTSVSGDGKFVTTTTGTVDLIFHGCKNNLGFNCASTGAGHLASSLTITATGLPFHLIMFATNKPAILVTPNEGVFAEFTCLGVGYKITGNGIIGTITKPACGASDIVQFLNFEGAAGIQSHMSYTGTKFDLHSKIGGINESTSAIATSPVLTFNEARKLECTHTT